MKFRKKLIKIFILSVFAPVLLLVFLFYVKIKNEYIKKAGNDYFLFVREKADRISYIIKDNYYYFQRICSRREFIKSIEKFVLPDLINEKIVKVFLKKNDGYYEITKNGVKKNQNALIIEKNLKAGYFLEIDRKRLKSYLYFKYLINDKQIIIEVNAKEIFYVLFRTDNMLPEFAIMRNDGFVLWDSKGIFYPIELKRDFFGVIKRKKHYTIIKKNGVNYILSMFYIKGFNFKGKEPPKYYIVFYKSLNEVLKPYKLSFLMHSLMVLMISILIVYAGYYDLKNLLKPIEKLEKSLKDIKQKNFNKPIKISTGDEFENIASTINSMHIKIKKMLDDLEEKNRKLVELNKVKSNFLSLISHELRTPLTIIHESVSQIIDGVKGPVNEEQKEFLLITKRNIKRLGKIVSDLLTISRIESGKITLKRRKTNVTLTIKSEFDLYKYKAEDKKIKMNLILPEKPVYLYCDEEKIRIIVANLLANALKFTDEGGEISVMIKDELNEIKIIVKDTGCGIPKEFRKKVFERFEKLSNLPLPGNASTGLGLAIVKEFVDMHKGAIFVESEEGKGSKFEIVLPKYTETKYFKEYFREKIAQASETNTDLSIVIMRLDTYEKSFVDVFEKKKVFSQIVDIVFKSVFDYEEIIPIKNLFEIYAFIYIDAKSCQIIIERLDKTVKEYLKDKKLSENFLINIISVTYPNDGSDVKTLLKKAGNLFHYLEPMRKKAKKIGQLALEKGLIDNEKLNYLLNRQKITGKMFGELLVEEQLVDSQELTLILSKQLDMPYVTYDEISKNIEHIEKIIKILTKEMIFERKILPVDANESMITIAMVNPFDIRTIKDIYEITNLSSVIVRLISMADYKKVVEII